MLQSAGWPRGFSSPGLNFDYAAPLSEMVLLGNVALRARGRKLQWDSAHLRIPNAPQLERHLHQSSREF